MDDALVRRWREGDATATTAVRNAVRSLAERLLSHSHLHAALPAHSRGRFSSELARRELTVAVAREVMGRKAETAAQINAYAVLSAGRMAVEALQEGRPVVGDAHLPPPVAVNIAIAPASVGARIREAADRHLAACPLCSRDVQLLAHIVAKPEDPPPAAEEEGEAVSAGNAEIDALIAETLKAEGQSEGRPAEKGAEARPARPAQAPRNEGRPRPAVRGGRAEAPARSGMSGALVGGLLLLVLAIGGGAYWLWRQSGASAVVTSSGPINLTDLVDRRPPRVASLDALPPEAQTAVRDLGAGDCRTAAGRFEDLRRKPPGSELSALYLLEAHSHVCAGDGRRATRALEALRSAHLPAPAGLHWVEAQAAMLRGDAATAIEHLERVRGQGGEEAAAAPALIEEIKRRAR